ncbi:MAG: hypothetical protein DCE87_04655 [Betaproteobacteria bacterium]|jgi:hypothetical protein|nr:MAG: hypothetical protein DCE87_04655 [Betaproteobacteria bacterium]PZO25759.1 MAG: hypothetical protein DCE89_02145 [Betaproteobacteria bacterium]PZO32689.1 MAG: hypothetical protein DCE88_00045 [Betaproteobacteria bacterium]
MTQEASQDPWVKDVGLFLAQRWKLISEDSLRLVAAQLASMPDWRQMPPEFAAKQFVLWTEVNCWVTGVNSADSLPTVLNHQRFRQPSDEVAIAIFRNHGIPPAQAASVCLLREIWGNAGYPEGVRPTSAAIDAMRVWQMAEEAVAKVYGEPVTLHLENGQLCALADKVFP